MLREREAPIEGPRHRNSSQIRHDPAQIKSTSQKDRYVQDKRINQKAYTPDYTERKYLPHEPFEHCWFGGQNLARPKRSTSKLPSLWPSRYASWSEERRTPFTRSRRSSISLAIMRGAAAASYGGGSATHLGPTVWPHLPRHGRRFLESQMDTLRRLYWSALTESIFLRLRVVGY